MTSGMGNGGLRKEVQAVFEKDPDTVYSYKAVDDQLLVTVHERKPSIMK